MIDQLDTRERGEAQKLAMEIATAAEAASVHLEKTANSYANQGVTPALAIAAYIIKNRRSEGR